MFFNLTDRVILLLHPKFNAKNYSSCINILLENDYPLHIIFYYFYKRIKNFNSIIKWKFKQDDKKENNSFNDNRKIIILPYVKHITD